MSKLTADQVIEIRRLSVMERWTQPRLARQFGVSVNTVQKILAGTSWQNAGGMTAEAIAAEGAKRFFEYLQSTQPASGASTMREAEEVPDILKPKPNKYF